MTWWRTEAEEVVQEIRAVRTQMAATLQTLQGFEERLRIVAERQEGLNIETASREDGPYER